MVEPVSQGSLTSKVLFQKWQACFLVVNTSIYVRMIHIESNVSLMNRIAGHFRALFFLTIGQV